MPFNVAGGGEGVRKIRTYLDVAGGGGFKSSQMSDIETRENYLYALF